MRCMAMKKKNKKKNRMALKTEKKAVPIKKNNI